MEDDALLQRGIAAARAKDFETARNLLAKYVKTNPNSEQAWLVLGHCVVTNEQRVFCFNKVLQLNPNNALARKRLQNILLVDTPSPASPSPAAITTSQVTPPEIEPLPQPQAETAINSNPAEKLSLWPALVGFLAGLLLLGIAAFFWLPNTEPPEFFNTLARAFVPAPKALAAGDSQSFRQLLPTYTPSNTPEPTFTPTSTLIPPPSATPDFQTRFDEAAADIALAKRDMQNEGYAEAILLWDKIIQKLPEYADAYNQRGICYRELTRNQRSFNEAFENANHALDDFSKAIELDSTVGDYYYRRYDVYGFLISLEEFNADVKVLQELGFQDLLKADALGNSFEWTERSIGFELIRLGRCKEGMEYTQELEAIAGPYAPPSAGINTAYALANVCLGNYSKALEHIDIALEVSPTDGREFDRLWILYNLGRYDEILEALDSDIENNPHYGAWRYYLRALIYYNRGQKELAIQDIQDSYGNTWEQYGVIAYLNGRFALDEGNEDEALEWFLLAQATLRPYYYYDQIIAENDRLIARLGGTPINPTPAPGPDNPTPTPLPPIEELLFATPTAYPPTEEQQPKPQGTATQVSIDYDATASYEGTGVFVFEAGDYPVIRFQPTGGFSLKSAETLTVKVEGGPEGEDAHLRLTLANVFFPSWGAGTNLVYGENVIQNVNTYVTDEGYIFLAIQNTGERVVLENISLRLIVIAPDGSEKAYGFH